ncbi:MAG: hypothetical protein G01um101413_863 [Parcubacteria group bacterium Gr01-1014_13]|nr:MAG: hypothetical protein G01um101413_863 [Parcubacteria group bacterium Gr01-1014_13]
MEFQVEPELPQNPIVGEGRLRFGSDDIVQRGHHGDGFVGQVAELGLELAEPPPVVLVEPDRVVADEGGETIACVVGIRSVHGRLRHGVQEVPERSGRTADHPFELAECLEVPGSDLHFVGRRRRADLCVGDSEQGVFLRVTHRPVERQLFVEFPSERCERTRVVLGHIANPVAPDGTELAAHELDRVAIVLHLEKNLGWVGSAVDDADSRDVRDQCLHCYLLVGVGWLFLSLKCY